MNFLGYVKEFIKREISGLTRALCSVQDDGTEEGWKRYWKKRDELTKKIYSLLDRLKGGEE